MSYWDKIKKLVSSTSPEKQKDEEIVFTPEELREMRDPDTLVGRLLNPYDVDKYAYPLGGARELYQHGLGTTEKSNKDNSLKDDETTGLIADTYIKDAEKRGVISPDEDRITKNYKIIDDIKKIRGLGDADIVQDTRDFFTQFAPARHGDYHPYAKRILLHPDVDPFDVADNKKEQKLNMDRHLADTIHEVMHAEDIESDPEKKPRRYRGHFAKADGRGWFSETPEFRGRIHEIEQAALQRLANMGKKKNE
jgi:hypothetical protein